MTCLSVVASVESHSVLPEVFEEGGQDLCLDVVGLHTISSTALLHHLGDGTESSGQSRHSKKRKKIYTRPQERLYNCGQRVQGENRGTWEPSLLALVLASLWRSTSPDLTIEGSNRRE